MSFLVLLILLIISYLDIKKKEISLPALLALAFTGLINIFCLKGFASPLSLVPGIILLFISFISGQALGLGDGLLIFVMGTILNFYEITFVLLFALLFASIISVRLFLKTKNKSTTIAFSPFIFISYTLQLML